jgi:hypothetical protein
MWRRVVLVRTDVSEERITSIFRAGESRREYSEQVAATATFLRNVGSNQDYTAPDPRRRLSSLKATFCSEWIYEFYIIIRKKQPLFP